MKILVFALCMHAWSALSEEYEYGSNGYGCQSCSWSAEYFFPRSSLRIWSRETGPSVPSRVSLLIIYTQDESCLDANSRDSSRFPRRRPHNIPSTAIGSIPSLSGHAITYRWRSLPRVHWYRASSPRGSSSKNGCCLFRFHHGPIVLYPSVFSHPLLLVYIYIYMYVCMVTHI